MSMPALRRAVDVIGMILLIALMALAVVFATNTIFDAVVGFAAGKP